jgi:hypothetical protein
VLVSFEITYLHQLFPSASMLQLSELLKTVFNSLDLILMLCVLFETVTGAYIVLLSADFLFCHRSQLVDLSIRPLLGVLFLPSQQVITGSKAIGSKASSLSSGLYGTKADFDIRLHAPKTRSI